MALGAALLFGVSAPLAKLLLGTTAPQLLAGLLYLGSGVGLGVVWLGRRDTRKEAKLTRRDAPWLVGAIGFGGVLGPLLLMAALAITPASSASLLLSLEAVFTATLAWFVFREHFDRRIALGMVMIVAGGVVLSWGGRLDATGVLGPLLIVAATLCLPHVLAAGALGFLSYGVSLVLFVLSLRQLGTARTGAYFASAPFVGAAVSLLIFRERPTATLLVGASLMAVGVWLHLTEHHSHEHRHETMEHEHLHVHDEHHQHVPGPDDPPGEPHSHRHRHEPLVHTHPHYPDIHHRHGHD